MFCKVFGGVVAESSRSRRGVVAIRPSRAYKIVMRPQQETPLRFRDMLKTIVFCKVFCGVVAESSRSRRGVVAIRPSKAYNIVMRPWWRHWRIPGAMAVHWVSAVRTCFAS